MMETLAKRPNLKNLIIAHGGHKKRCEKICVMEAVAWVAGEPHSDHPTCACPVISAFMRSWNDSLPSDADRNRLLKPLIKLLVNTRSTPEVEKQRSMLALNWLIREFAPKFLMLHQPLVDQAAILKGLPEITEKNASEIGPKVNEVNDKASAADSAARSAAYSAADSAAASAAYSAARSAAYSAADSAAASAAYSAARSAARSAAYSAADSAADSAAYSAARSAAYSAAASAAETLLKATITECQDSAVDLVKRMCALGRKAKRKCASR